MTRMDSKAALPDFAAWAKHAHGSPLYRALASHIAEDPEVAELASRIERRPIQNMLFGAVQFLLSSEDELARFYPSRTQSALPASEAYPTFRRFALDHAVEIIDIGRTRHVQTNEVRRIAAMLPALAAEAERLGEPVHIVEVGAAAGLNLCLDRFQYDFAGLEFGHSDVALRIEVEGDVDVPSRAPYVQRRVGIDLEPLDPGDPDDLRWLESLIWPEQAERRRRLRSAVRVRATVQVEMVRADASAAIGGVLDRLPTSGPAIVFHAFSWNQFPPGARVRFDRAIAAAASRRSISRIGFEYWDRDAEWPEIRVGLVSEEMVSYAVAHPHGEWLRAL